ncbi:helix-hairpin-helix domain-containing protein [uncultured Ilumatobacter sp.]|jgi:competence protein ComEA|uniref:helix-hairpin-helix domain-containing protein n=1 Tax=uncultured Ilumatobacter sp. TaxID=879968 RepID=UPI00374EDE5B
MEEVFRPEPVRNLSERTKAWIGWFGLSRLIASAVAVLIVCGGAYWLVRTPPPPSEAALPRVEAAGSPVSTLRVPITVAPEVLTSPTSGVTVHVAGSVLTPGVYVLDSGARVHEAIDRAGGVTGDADVDTLNLAAPLADGSRIYVPAIGEEVSAMTLIDVPFVEGAVDDLPVGPIDINRATATEMDGLPGVGPATATAIVTERQRNGPFLSVDDLQRVPGIGPARLASIRDLVTV